MTKDVPASRHLLAGFAGGLTSAVCLQPLDLVKTRVQQSQGNSIVSVLRQISSIKELWRGTLPSAVRTSVGTALYLTSLNFIRTKMAIHRLHQHPGLADQQYGIKTSSKLPRLPAGDNLIAGMISRTIVGFITMPITVIKVRFESDMYHYNSLWEGVTLMYKKEGFRSFFTGFGATCMRDAPYAGLYMAFYEKNKMLLPKLFHTKSVTSDSTLSPRSPSMMTASTSAVVNSVSAIFAAFFATAITGPFDTIKTNMQLNPTKYKTFIQSTVTLASRGWLRLFDGLSLRLLRKAGSAGIAWCIYEQIVRL